MTPKPDRLNGNALPCPALVILDDGISASVNISEIAGLFERGGLRGWDSRWALLLLCYVFSGALYFSLH